MPIIKRFTFVAAALNPRSDSFAHEWREQAYRRYDATAVELRPIRLAHCVVRPGRRPKSTDGVAICWFSDTSAMVAHDRFVADLGRAENPPVVDEARTTTAVVEERCVFGQSWIEECWRMPSGSTRLLVLGLVEKAEHASRIDFRDYWWDKHRPLANRLLPPDVQPIAYNHNYVVPGDPCRWDGIGEFFDASVEVARQRAAWGSSDEAHEIIADECRFLKRDTRVGLVTDFEVIVPGRPPNLATQP
jgi:hypothetical protein